MNNVRKGKILALIPEGLNYSNSQRRVGTTEQLEELIVKTTLCVNTHRADNKELNEILKDEEAHLTKYDQVRRAKAAETRKKNQDYIEEKYATLSAQDYHPDMTLNEVDENAREMRRKIAMEKNMLNQMGHLEGCLT